jgi:hypothetical protein
VTAELNPYRSPTVVDLVDGDLWLTAELKRVRAGLLFVYYGIVAMLLSVLAAPLLGVLIGAGGMGPGGGIAVGLLFAIGFFGGSIAIFVGQVMCTAVPAESRAKSMAIAAVITQCGGFLLTFGSTMLLFVAAAPTSEGVGLTVGSVVQWTSMIAGVASFFLFVIFLRRLNEFIGSVSLAGSATSVLRLMIAIIALYLLTMAVVLFPTIVGAAGQVGMVGGILGILLIITGLVTFIKYANLVLYSAKAIGKLPQRELAASLG